MKYNTQKSLIALRDKCEYLAGRFELMGDEEEAELLEQMVEQLHEQIMNSPCTNNYN